jgi:hypothetical protein
MLRLSKYKGNSVFYILEIQSGLKSINLNHSLVLMGTSRCKPASQFVERHDSVGNCALNMEQFL